MSRTPEQGPLGTFCRKRSCELSQFLRLPASCSGTLRNCHTHNSRSWNGFLSRIVKPDYHTRAISWICATRTCLVKAATRGCDNICRECIQSSKWTGNRKAEDLRCLESTIGLSGRRLVLVAHSIDRIRQMNGDQHLSKWRPIWTQHPPRYAGAGGHKSINKWSRGRTRQRRAQHHCCEESNIASSLHGYITGEGYPWRQLIAPRNSGPSTVPDSRARSNGPRCRTSSPSPADAAAHRLATSRGARRRPATM